MNILKELALDDKCSYLPNKEQTTYFKIVEHCTTLECQELIERGFRRFGKAFFRPVCTACNECQSIKIAVDNFTFSKSARRVLNKASLIKSFIQKPSLSKEHLRLFEKYHLYMKDKKGWEHHQTTINNYYSSFVEASHDFGYEVLYFYEDKLIGVDLIDILYEGISSIYFYYDPEFSHYSLGRLSLYNQIKFAKNSHKKWVYLGYYVQDCPSLSYKAEYKPYLTLQGRPELYDDYLWI
ncbi:MAG: leucyl-tRNA---protein transferase [Campylobacterota bacterium]|nr:leucyl-tRNA---protein transferase [Campylobacterota bacterium]